MTSLLFSTDGRINRARFWLVGLGVSFGLTLLLAAVLFALWQVIPGEVTEKGAFSVNGVAALPYIGAVFAWFVLQIWTAICLGIKRYHDLDKPGTWVLVGLIPVVGSLIYLVQAGFTRGTPGANRYGADPLPAGA